MSSSSAWWTWCETCWMDVGWALMAFMALTLKYFGCFTFLESLLLLLLLLSLGDGVIQELASGHPLHSMSFPSHYRLTPNPLGAWSICEQAIGSPEKYWDHPWPLLGHETSCLILLHTFSHYESTNRAQCVWWLFASALSNCQTIRWLLREKRSILHASIMKLQVFIFPWVLVGVSVHP